LDIRSTHSNWNGNGNEFGWFKYALAALAIHAAVVAIPVTHKATQIAKQKVIDVIVMRQEKPPAPPPIVEKKQLVPKPILKAKEPERVENSPLQNKVLERKEVQPSGGGGNAINERMVAQVTSGPATGTGDGVAVSGVNVGGGKVGLGNGSGTGHGSGTGTLTTPVQVPAPVETGPVEARIGDADGPQWIYREKPEYPFAARRLGREGRVDMMVTLDDKGKLIKVDVVRATDESFAQAAVEAVKRSKFAPAKRKGNPVGSRSPFTIHFAL
jgi:periplasmic protein TonB